jgi:AraC-like DNA-binding protein
MHVQPTAPGHIFVIPAGHNHWASWKRVTLAEVAYRVGFADQSHFSRHFRRINGASPDACAANADRTERVGWAPRTQAPRREVVPPRARRVPH